MSHWWCPTCKQAILGCNVTYEEYHDNCGASVQWVEGEELSKSEKMEQQLKQSQDRERVLQEKLDMLQETHTDNEGNVWEAPTSYAYYTACSALYKHKDREIVLREALEEIKTISSVAEQLTTFYEAESLRSLIESIAIEALEASK